MPGIDYEVDESGQDLGLPEAPDAVLAPPKRRLRYEQEMADALERKRISDSTRPRIGDAQFQPGLGHTIANAAAQFGAAYVNAGGRTHVDPKATERLGQELSHPGYSKAVENWQGKNAGIDDEIANYSHLQGLEDKADAAVEGAKARQEQSGVRTATQEAQKERAGAERARRISLEQQKDDNLVLPSGDVVSRKDPSKVLYKTYHRPEPPPKPEKVDDTPAKRAKLAENMQWDSPREKNYYIKFNKPLPEPKVGKGAGKITRDPNLAPQNTFEKIENDKQKEMKVINDTELDKGVDGGKHQMATIDAQRRYLARVQAAGGKVNVLPKSRLAEFAAMKGMTPAQVERDLLMQGTLVQ